MGKPKDISSYADKTYTSRYLCFAYEDFYPGGGLSDVIGEAGSLEAG